MHGWPYCTGRHVARVAILHARPHCTGGHIAREATLHARPHCTRGHIARETTLHGRPHRTGGHIAQVATLHRWPRRTGGHIAQVATLHSWRAGSARSRTYTRAHAHACLHTQVLTARTPASALYRLLSHRHARCAGTRALVLKMTASPYGMGVPVLRMAASEQRICRWQRRARAITNMP